MSNTQAVKNRPKLLTTRELVFAAMLTALIAVCSWISIPIGPIVFTLQTFAIFCTLSFLGGKAGLLSIVVYIFLGAVGLPVFSGFAGGIGALLRPTGGYIVGFIFMGLIYLAGEKLFGSHIAVKIVSMLLGIVALYTFGTAWFMYLYTKNTGAVTLMQALKWCVIPFIPLDLIKMALALVLVSRIKKYVKL